MNTSRSLFNLECEHCHETFSFAHHYTQKAIVLDTLMTSSDDIVSIKCPYCGRYTQLIESDADVMYAVSSIPCIEYIHSEEPLRLLFKSHEKAIEEMNRRVDSVFDADRLIKITSDDDENRIVLVDAITTELAFVANIEIILKSDFVKDNVSFDFLRREA